MLTTKTGNVSAPILMNVDNRMGSCRDKGRMWGRVGAWWQRAPVGTAWSKQVAPQRGQAQGLLIHSTPPLVPTGPWAASISMDRIPRFGRQNSLGLDLAGGLTVYHSFLVESQSKGSRAAIWTP